MSELDLVPDVVELLGRFIWSADELQVVLVTADRPRGLWTVGMLAARASLSVEATLEAVDSLKSRAFFEAISPSTFTVAHAIRPGLLGELTHAYQQHQADVLRVMNRNAMNRVRLDAARRFGPQAPTGGKAQGRK